MPVSVDDVAAVVLSRVGRVEAMKLQKLVYYSQAWHIALTDEVLFHDTVQAWNRGPVVDTLWQRHRGRRTITSWDAGHPEHVRGTSKKVVVLVCDVYGQLSGDDLSELTHQELPWREARAGTPDGEYSRTPIKVDVMKQFYRRRQLAGRSVADLVAGGVAGFVDPQVDGAQRKRLFADIRSEFSGLPQHGPGLPAPVGIGFREDCERDRPGTVRLSRERPLRGRAG